MPPRNTPDPDDDPDDESAAAIERQIAELQAKLARKQAADNAAPPRRKPKKPTAARVKTGGGAAVQGSVKLHNGNFIGRDSIRIVNQVVHQGEHAEDAQLALASSLHALATDLAGLRLGDIDAATDQTRQEPLQLPDIYVPLATTFSLPEGTTLAQALAARDVGEALLGASGRAPKMRAASALEALAACRALTLLGAPGSGKSTFGAFVLLALAQAWQGQRNQLEALGEGWPHGALLPVRVVLRRFAEQHAGGSRKLTAGDIWQFIGQDLHDGGWGAADRAIVFVQRLARQHGALVLFDGLDECGDQARRDRVLAAVQAFMRSEAPKSRFVLTARPYALPEGADPKRGVFALAEFDDERIEQFIAAWYAALARRGWRSEAAAAVKRDELIAAYPRGDLLPLARNPLLLTLMATLHSNRGRLPDDRVQLYNETVELLLQRWNKDVGADRALLDALAIPSLTLGHLRGAMEALAFKVHEANVGESGLAEIGEDDLNRAFRPLLGGSKDKADQVVEFIERRAGLLLGQGERDGERRFTFPHRTFQEFLAACHLSTRENFARECGRLAGAEPAHWRVVLPLAARLAKAERGATAADELIGGVDVDAALRRGKLNAAHWERALIAGLQLQEIGAAQLGLSERTLAVLGRVKGWLAAGLPLHPHDGGAPAVHRARAGDVLAALGDSRFDSDLFQLPADDDLGFVQVPADPAFLIGTRSGDRVRGEAALGRSIGDDEINDEPVATAAFWIARFPVTVAQFRAFVEATGYRLGGAAALRDPDNRPVRWVNWLEAMAYCDWLHDTLVADVRFADHRLARLVREQGWRVALPSELEWELAARGGRRGQVFSWGDSPDPQSANYAGSGVGTTSAVGCFPPNALGLNDMLGNVWEWTRSLFGEYPYPSHDVGRESGDAGGSRVVRGGSWDLIAAYARCACRLRLRPVYRFDYLGFRVVLRSAHVLRPLLLARPQGGVARRRKRADGVPAMQDDSHRGFACRGEGRRTAPDASGPRACSRWRGSGANCGASPAPGAY